jgi:tyrosine-protein kinase Etk/Wzc
MQTQNTTTEDPGRPGLLDLLILLLERKWLFVGGVFAFCVAGVGISLITPKFYTATAVIMKPAAKMPGLGSLLSKELPVSGILKSMDIGGGGDADNFLSVLESRRMAEIVVRRFNLVHHYGFDKMKKYYVEDLLKVFHKSTKISENDWSNIEVAVTDSSPAMASDIANFMVLELDTISYQLAKESAQNSRVFFEERLALIRRDLDTAARRLTDFQTENNYIDLERQTRSSVEALAQFEAQRMALDLEISQLQSQYGSGGNQRIAELVKQKSVIGREIGKYMAAGGGNLIIALKDAPAKSVKYGYLLRDVKIQESLYEFVLQLYEQAKFSESNNVPVVQVLEYAQTPQKKTRPKRSIICIMFFVTGCFTMTAYIVWSRWMSGQKKRNTPFFRKTRYLVDLLLFRNRNTNI